MNSDFLKNFHYTPDGATTRADALCGFIKDEIAYGRLKAGDTIPTIKELSAKYSVSAQSPDDRG